MEDGLEVGSECGETRSDRAEVLLDKIARLLKVDPAYFFARRGGPSSASSGPADGRDFAELVRLFHAIEDPELRRSAVDLMRILKARDGSDPDS